MPDTDVLPYDDPFDWFEAWYERAQHAGLLEPTAMSLATVDAGGQPAVRIVLLKQVDRKGFVFYTNFESRKGRALLAEPKCGLNFYWPQLGQQVRVEGVAHRVSPQEADAYFASRARGSQLGAWASQQSRPLASRADLEEALAEVEARFQGQEVPRPPHWSGMRVVPTRIEFWQAGESRLHDRWEFVRPTPEVPFERHRLFP
ncbi:pyridoxamine 5'-phosphate oxidase [Lujinxingia litoralis]|uniref:Pyridoxamine 5'-phosphate oxidase n=1 Tax=Lujinxingia litoralis TaxID=2211119 RepID=A0A328C3W1_9DELT|nr:pyridoxamine 5'-phosphate oxidase [Lujinxingia litoralis]RAL20988.1 pyridoxamine 5'-phosphate oxidase [Lujinxingia litoralis]